VLRSSSVSPSAASSRAICRLTADGVLPCSLAAALNEPASTTTTSTARSGSSGSSSFVLMAHKSFA